MSEPRPGELAGDTLHIRKPLVRREMKRQRQIAYGMERLLVTLAALRERADCMDASEVAAACGAVWDHANMLHAALNLSDNGRLLMAIGAALRDSQEATAGAP